MATQSSVRKQALLKLGKVARGQAPTNDLDSDMAQAYTEVYKKLQADNRTFWGQALDIPDEISNDIAAMMAFYRLNDYGIGSERYQRITVEYQQALANIQSIPVNKYISSTDPQDF